MYESAVFSKGLIKRFGEFVAVNGIDLDIRTGECFGFLGPNGAGKSTTMKMVCGLLKPTNGSIHVGGVDVRINPLAVKAKIGYLPENAQLYERLTGKENLELIQKRLDGWQLESFKESYNYKTKNGISLFKKKTINESK